MAGEKFTPGPWEVGDVDRNGQRIVRGEHIEVATCWHHSVGSIEKQMEANARLIAAAPSLYEALKPFAEHAVAMLEVLGDASGPDERIVHGMMHRSANITVGDLRKARAALSQAQAQKD